MRIPRDSDRGGKVCQWGEAMIIHPLRRDYKRGKKVNMVGFGKLERKHREIEGSSGKYRETNGEGRTALRQGLR